MTPLEVAANAVTAVSIWLAGRNRVHTWWTGIVGCVLFALLFQEAKLYADVALQGFFLATSAVGWWHWAAHAARDATGSRVAKAARPVTHSPPAEVAVSIAAGGAAAVGYGWLLHRYTDAYAPFVDSGVLAFSVVAQLLLMRRRVESWPFWLVVNTVAVPLYASRDLWLTSALYAAYWVNALVAWRHWRRLAANAPAGTAAPA